MPLSPQDLRRQLKDAGFTEPAIEAAWPEWWSTEAESSVSATSELRFTIARRLGLSPSSLFDGPPSFVWHDQAKFKNLGTESPQDRAILTAFGTAVGRHAMRAVPATQQKLPVSALQVRALLLQISPVIGLTDLLTLCWAVGIPVLYLALFPLGNKRMHAMSVRLGERYAILIGRESRYAAQVAYWIAHELGHVMLQHVPEGSALLEIEDPLQLLGTDEEEGEADSYALTLLTGESQPVVASDTEGFSATQLADAAIRTAPGVQIDPGILALCLGHSSRRWKQAFGALKMIPPGEQDVRGLINALALHQLEQSSDLGRESRPYLHKVLGLSNEP
jgi:hypothetical protein